MPPTPPTPYALYVAGVIGALGLLLVMRSRQKRMRAAGALIGMAGVGLLFAEALRAADRAGLSQPWGFPLIPCILGAIAIAGATRMVTHPKPVFAALYFVLVVVSSAGLFLSLEAEFMAFALVIVYAGAILITYMFVLMLAQQSPNESPGALSPVPGATGDIEAGTMYDRVPREPLAATLIGFILLATLGETVFTTRIAPSGADEAAAVARATAQRWDELETLPRRLNAVVQSIRPGATLAPGSSGRAITVHADGGATVRVQFDDGGTTTFAELPLPADAGVTNVQSVGLALVKRFPASLELASVILLMAMFGAVVLARKQIELGEDERREAAGMRRISMDDPDPGSSAGGVMVGAPGPAASRGGRA